MMKIFKYFLFAVLFLNLYSETQVHAKPVPPGSGEGDVPANILFLIDSSASMSRRISNRDAVFGMTNAIYDSNGDILGGQLRNLALVNLTLMEQETENLVMQQDGPGQGLMSAKQVIAVVQDIVQLQGIQEQKVRQRLD